MSTQHQSFSEVTLQPEHHGSTRRIWVVMGILSVITLIELLLGFGLARHWYGDPVVNYHLILFVKGVICILTLLKAYYIVSVFMHLGDEVKNFITTIIIPVMLFVWFIISFLWEGESWKNMKNTNAGSREYKTEQVQQAIPAIQQHEKP
ncbi:MAG TPA: cytochrome C oxidase subunit IV family protein [Ferruginibacter sp.]|nr:cytochrome C oxidase subunit IV family protein [Ferruginibacter sp.]